MRKPTLARPRRLVSPQGRQPHQGGQQHFRILRPLETHWRKADCREVECAHHQKGWATVVPTGGAQADYIRRKSGRHFTEARQSDDLAAFTFPPGQRGFRPHRLPADKQEHYIHDGRLHDRPIDWVEDFNETTDKVKRQLERG